MGLAGAKRIFELMDQDKETDNGYVTLVNAEVSENGEITESKKRTGKWAWKHPHKDGTTTYTLLRGDVRLTNVDFAYEEGKEILHDVTVYAEPRAKSRFCRSYGSGKNNYHKPDKPFLRYSRWQNTLRRNKHKQNTKIRLTSFSRRSFTGYKPFFRHRYG